MNTQAKLDRAHAEALAAHDDWLRRLVRGLCADGAAADDVVQDTYVAAMKAGPDAAASIRGWLGTVARRLSGRSRRATARRRRWERAAARGEADTSTAELVQRIELRQRVTRAVLALDEPFRSTVLERFYENRTPREIAQRLGIPAGTVRSRLCRALAQLRDELADGGGRSDWRAALAAAVPVARRAQVASTGTLMLAAKLQLALGAAALALLAAVVWWLAAGGPGAGSAPVDVPVPTAGGETVRTGVKAPHAPTGEGRTEIADSGGTAGDTKDPATEPVVVLSGVVLDPRGRPLPGVPLWLADSSDERTDREGLDRTDFAAVSKAWLSLGATDAAGEFAVSVPPESAGWLAVGPPWVTLRPLAVEPQSPRTGLLVVAARAVAIAGVVTDPDGNPLAGVEISGFCERIPAFPAVLDRNARPAFLGGTTDDGGRFALGRVPGCAAVELTFAKSGYESGMLACPTADRRDLAVVLSPLEQPGVHLFTGRVLDPDGAPVAGAKVGLGDTKTRTGADGCYRLAVADISAGIDADEVLYASAPGYVSAVRQDLAAIAGGAAREHQVDLQLGRPAGSIRGRVVDANGQPRPDLRVYLWDVQYLGSSPQTLAGFEVGADDDWFGTAAETGDDGRFVLGPLPDRAYRLRLYDARIPFAMTTRPLRPGPVEVDITIPEDAVHERVAGVVIDGGGRPVSGARVRFWLDLRMRGGEGVFTTGGEGVTDESGRFVLRDVPRAAVRLVVEGDDVLPARQPLDADGVVTGLTLVVHRRCHLRVTAEGAPDGAELVVLDGEGRPVTIYSYSRNGHIHRDHWPLGGGGTQVLTVPDDAQTAVLRRGETELARRPITVRPGIVVEVMLAPGR